MVFLSTISGANINSHEDVIVRLTYAEFSALCSLEGGADKLPGQLLWAIRTVEDARQRVQTALEALTAVPESMKEKVNNEP